MTSIPYSNPPWTCFHFTNTSKAVFIAVDQINATMTESFYVFPVFFLSSDYLHKYPQKISLSYPSSQLVLF